VAEMLGESGGGYDDPRGAPLPERLPEGSENLSLHLSEIHRLELIQFYH
jgi:hypothetical protein